MLPVDVKLHVFMLNSVSTGQDGLGAVWSESVELLITITGGAPTFDGTDYPQSSGAAEVMATNQDLYFHLWHLFCYCTLSCF